MKDECHPITTCFASFILHPSSFILFRSLRSPFDNELRGSLVSPRLVTLGRLPPRAHRMPATRSLSFAAAKRVINRIHRHAAVMRHLSQVALPPGFADRYVLVLEVADLTDRRVAAVVHFAHLARRKPQGRPFAFAGHQLGARSRRTRHLSALPFLQLD